MSAPAPRRNAPCPCGSGRRYKECHGRLAGAEPSVDALVRQALQLHQQGRVDEAEARYREILEREPGNAIATHYLGLATWHRGDIGGAERLMRESIDANAAIPDFHNNLGLLLRDSGRLEAAIACFRRTLEVDAGWIEAYNNLALALESAGRWKEALDAYRRAIEAEPRFAAAHQNLGRALLALGQYGAGWEHYRWRLAAQGLSREPPDPARQRLPATLAGRRFALRAEQGIGDVLFFLRFAPELARRGAALAFRGDARLHALLERTGYFSLGFDGEAAPSPGLETVFVGDLPWLLQADAPQRFPPLALVALPERTAAVRARLASLGPGPYVGLTWRAGTTASGPVRVQLKELAPAALGERLRGRAATWVSVQRLPREGETQALEQALGARVHDAAAANADLEEILAWMAVLDDYVGVSSANAHLRAGVGRPMQVLVPFPPEWRWGIEGDASPWFPGMSIVRQSPAGAWPDEWGQSRIIATR